jgi:hypothetical protein
MNFATQRRIADQPPAALARAPEAQLPACNHVACAPYLSASPAWLRCHTCRSHSRPPRLPAGNVQRDRRPKRHVGTVPQRRWPRVLGSWAWRGWVHGVRVACTASLVLCKGPAGVSANPQSDHRRLVSHPARSALLQALHEPAHLVSHGARQICSHRFGKAEPPGCPSTARPKGECFASETVTGLSSVPKKGS